MFIEYAIIHTVLKPAAADIGTRPYGHPDWKETRKTAVIAYTDDMTILLTTPGDVRRLQETLHTYEAATGAKVKMQKSRTFAFGNMGHG